MAAKRLLGVRLGGRVRVGQLLIEPAFQHAEPVRAVAGGDRERLLLLVRRSGGRGRGVLNVSEVCFIYGVLQSTTSDFGR